MKERPILFNGEMVRAILDGRKTQTRHIVRHAIKGAPKCIMFDNRNNRPLSSIWADDEGMFSCPFGKPDEQFWVRESIQAAQEVCKFGIRYLADGAIRWLGREHDEQWLSMDDYRGAEGATVPSIHMPRWASRITLKITNVRVERLNNISKKDAIAEGSPPSHPSIDAI